MKGLLIVLVLLAVAVAAFGFYRGWFHVSSDKTDPNANVTVTVDRDQIQADKEKVENLGHGSKGKPAEPVAEGNGPDHRP